MEVILERDDGEYRLVYQNGVYRLYDGVERVDSFTRARQAIAEYVPEMRELDAVDEQLRLLLDWPRRVDEDYTDVEKWLVTEVLRHTALGNVDQHSLLNGLVIECEEIYFHPGERVEL